MPRTLIHCVPSAGTRSRIDERFEKGGILSLVVEARRGDGKGGWPKNHRIVKGGIGPGGIILALVVAPRCRGDAGEKAVDGGLDALHPVRHAVASAAGLTSGRLDVAGSRCRPRDSCRVGCRSRGGIG